MSAAVLGTDSSSSRLLPAPGDPIPSPSWAPGAASTRWERGKAGCEGPQARVALPQGPLRLPLSLEGWGLLRLCGQPATLQRPSQHVGTCPLWPGENPSHSVPRTSRLLCVGHRSQHPLCPLSLGAPAGAPTAGASACGLVGVHGVSLHQEFPLINGVGAPPQLVRPTPQLLSSFLGSPCHTSLLLPGPHLVEHAE